MEDNRQTSIRIWVILFALFLGMIIVSGRLAWLQLVQADSMEAQVEELLHVEDTVQPERGAIYDRSGSILAAPGSDFQFGVDLPILADKDGNRIERTDLALELSSILQMPYSEILALLTPDDPDALYAAIASRITTAQADAIKQLDYRGLAFTPIPRRLYPQGKLGCHILGYVDYEGRGLAGVEGWWDADLAGEAASRRYENVPSQPRQELIAREGVDLVLTIDRAVQSTVERHLVEAINEYEADNGEIIVMDPQTGEILAMASTPCYDPFTYFDIPEEDVDQLINPSISKQYEPGSVMKLMTMAIGIDSGTVSAGSTYMDNGVIVRGGITIQNAEEKVYGPLDMTNVLINSVNTATAWLSTLTGSETFYNYMDRFGFGQPTGVDMAHEISGYVPEPGNASWTEATLATNAFGQGISVTPLQMLSAASAIANGGQQMQPHVVREIRSGDTVIESVEPRVMSNPITHETAQIITAMAVQVVSYLDVPGYTVAGKTGTAQIPVIPDDGGAPFYHPEDTIASFVGWLPADDPALAIIVKLDVPKTSEWGTETAAPAFEKLARELTVLLDVPPDGVRHASR